MKILAVDSVGKTIEVALLVDNKRIKRNLELNKNASEFLLSLIDQILTDENLTLNDLDYLGLNIGPGSFTGIRIAMSLFKGFMVSLSHLKCIVVNSFDILSYNINSDKFLLALDSGTSSYYCMIKDGTFTTFLALEKDEILKQNYELYSDSEFENAKILTKNENSLIDCILFALKHNNIKNEYELEPLYVKKAQSEREYKQKFLTNVKIENAVLDNLEDIYLLEKNCFNELEAYTKEQLKNDILENKILIAKNDKNVILGYIDYLLTDQIEILKICVDKDNRNLGIGQTLINKLSLYQKDIFLEVSENNLAKNFYAKLGFKLITTRKKYYKDGSDALILVKRFC